MSILKVILHRWNKTTKSHDTIHPETEVSQVTDWNQGIVNTLASTALGALVNTLTSDSLLATMIKKVLTATGVKYNTAQNGYFCFGSLFGGLIIQWISASCETTSFVGYLPISFTNKCFACSANDMGSACISLGIQASTSNYTVYQPLANLTYIQAIFIGY